MQSGIFVFVEAQEKNLRRNLQGSEYNADFIFLCELFSCYEKTFSS